MSRAERIASRNPVGRAVRSVRASAWCLLAAASTGIASCATAPSGPEPAPIAAESIEAPLVLPGTVEPSGSTLAAASLAEVRKALGTPPASAGGPPPREPIDAVEATRLYVRGRAAATEGRMLVAASELERAHDLDPGSAAILEELGRVQGRLGNARRAAECHELLLAIRPNDAEALFSSGVAAASRGDLPRAIERLATLYDLEPAARARGLQGFRGEARTIADLALARALVALGADAAAAGVLERADGEAPPDLPPSIRADLGITLGDALARTGNLPGAIAAWQGAIVDVPGAEIRGLPRLLWAAVRSGADREAMSMLSTAIAAGPPSDELVALARWFAQARPGAAAELAGRIDDRRLRAALLGPDRGRKLLAAAVADDPENAPIELLREWFAALETDTAIDEAMRLVAAHPARAEACASALVRSGATAGGLIAAVDRTEGRRGRGTLEPALAAALRDEARLARIADEVASGGGGPRELAATATAIARLGDESTVERLAARVDATVGITQATRSRILAALSEAARGAGASLRARELAERAVAAHRNPETISALARVRLDEALSRPVEDRGAILADALALVDEATADPRAPDSAWRLRLAVVDALGEPTKRGAVRAAIRANRPGSALDRQVTRDALVAEGRAAEAVDLAAIRAAAVPTDLDAFRFTIAAVPRTGQGERLRPWLLGRQVAMPAEPDSLEAHVALLLASGGEENALELLRRRASGVPPEPFAAALLERALVDRGRAREAWLAAKARRDAGMDASGVRGELRFAALSLEAGESATAAVTLETLAARAAELSPGAALAAARLAERLPADSDGRDRLASALGLAAARDPSPERLDASLLVARLAARRLERSGSETDRDDLRRAIALAIAAAATDAWREPSVEAFLAVAQGLADDEHHAAASELLATAVRDDPAMPAPVAGRLVVAACALDAVAGGRWERSLELVRLVRSRGARPFSNAGDPAEREAEAIHRLSGLYSFLDDRIGADRLLEVSLALEPDHAMSLNNLAYSAIDRGEIDAETVRRAERAHELMPADPSVLDTLGWLRYKQGRFRDDASGPGAIALIRRSIEARPDDPGLEPLDHLGDALWRAGDRNAAIRAWRAAAEILPRRHPVDSILNGLPEYERREQGVRLLDPREFWQRSYGDVGERAARKAATALAGGEPAVAPLAAAPPAP